MGKYIAKVEPHRAVLESDYFINLIKVAEELRDEEIDKIEAGYDFDDESNIGKPKPGDEWRKLQTAPNDEYLMRTVLPVLY